MTIDSKTNQPSSSSTNITWVEARSWVINKVDLGLTPIAVTTLIESIKHMESIFIEQNISMQTRLV